MKKYYLLLFFQFIYITTFSQNGFQFLSKKDAISVPFQLINNLVIIPIEVNGVKLNFLLDTGVEKTILFSLEETDSIAFENVEKISIKGLGSGKPIDALHSKDNKLAVKDYVDFKHEIYIILDEQMNFSAQLGVPVHGIIGYEFFKNNLIRISYKSKKIFIYKKDYNFSRNKLQKYEEIPITLEYKKPYS